ncbi:MAG: DNA sulfur modification protein DndD, partial [Clostridiaceae bacterium]|nr:DNA sulfur modification protein DndD [Clostridiaceae bacterium]
TEEDISYAEFAYILSAQTQDRVILPVEFDKDRLSSGEKQIFVMALYWALIQQSEQNLPYIIDTPFARIDTEHRSNIVEYFFKDLPGQLFILSTNEEINRAHLASMDEQIAHMFTLQYGVDQRTYIHENHFFEVS